MNVLETLNTLADHIDGSIVYKQRIWEGRLEGDWSKFWSSYDALRDSQQAIGEWVSSEKPQRLELYGLLQALIIQQDSIKHLQEAMGLTPVYIKDNYPDLNKMRMARNHLAGHPSQNKFGTRDYKDGTQTHTTIGYNKDSRIIEYVVSSVNGSERHKLVLQDFVNAQELMLLEQLKTIMSKIEKEDNTHKTSFEQNSLSEMLHTADYLASKAYSFERDPFYAQTAIKSLVQIYADFKKEICKRYKVPTLSETIHIPGLVGEIDKTDKVLPRVVDMLKNREDTDNLDLDVYAESLHNSIRHLQKMAEEIDKEFEVEVARDTIKPES
jgi:hypothetical protein